MLSLLASYLTLRPIAVKVRTLHVATDTAHVGLEQLVPCAACDVDLLREPRGTGLTRVNRNVALVESYLDDAFTIRFANSKRALIDPEVFAKLAHIPSFSCRIACVNVSG